MSHHITMSAKIRHACDFCDYSSTRKHDLNRHCHNKHPNDILNKKEENNEFALTNVPTQYSCSLCNKLYKTLKYLLQHEKTCDGLDHLTCQRCMKSFKTRQNKYKHIKRDTCKAKSRIHAINSKNGHIPYIESQNNVTNIVINNIDNKTINNTFIINNYGQERTDYLTDKDIYKILRSCENTIPKYIKSKHFNEDFPENHNIVYNKKTKLCKVKKDNEWLLMNTALVSSKLIQDSSSSLLSYIYVNEELFYNTVKDDEIADSIKDTLSLIKNKMDNVKYKIVYNAIKTFLENHKYDDE